MPKMKTHRGAAKRFKVTGTGKLRRLPGHHATTSSRSKPSKRTRRLDGEVERRPAATPHRIKRLLGRK